MGESNLSQHLVEPVLSELQFLRNSFNSQVSMIVIPVLLVIPELLRTLSKQPSWLSPRLTSTLPQIFGARPKSSNLHLLSGLISSKSMEKQKLPVHQEAAVVIVVAAEAVVEAEVAVVTVVVAEEEVTEPIK